MADVCWTAVCGRPTFVEELCRRGRIRLCRFVGHVLAVSAVATEFHCVELSSGKCDVLVRHFQTAVVSVGFEIDAINSYKRDRRAPNVITSTSQIVRKHHGPYTSFIQQQQLAKQASVVGDKQ